MKVDAELRRQLAYLERSSTFYRERLGGLGERVRGLAARAREAGMEPAALGLRRIITAGETGAGLAAVRAEIEATWAAAVADTFGMSDVWSTMAGECGRGEGLHLTTGARAVLELVDPGKSESVPLTDGATGELVWTHLRREASPLLRYRSAAVGTVWTSPCAC